VFLTVLTRSNINQHDADLLKRIQKKDRQALAMLYDRYAPVVYPLAVRVVGSTEEAQQVLQEAFAHIWEKAGGYVADRGSIFSWVIAVCRNKAIDKLRLMRDAQRTKEGDRGTPRPSAERGTDTAAQQVLAFKGYTEAVRSSLKSLSKLEERILEMSYYDSHSQSDIARTLRMPLSSVKSKLRRGIQKLRQAARKEGVA
jgi:RNA polymerase sigma-70 factor (ECF subfamily)